MRSPRYMNPQDHQLRVRIKIIERQQENFNESQKPRSTLFPGVGRALSGPEPPASTSRLSVNLAVDPEAPTTLIQVRLADRTRIVSRFNTHQTVRDVRDFIDSITPGDSKDSKLLIMGSPPTPLPDDFDQTIEIAGISNSVLLQSFF